MDTSSTRYIQTPFSILDFDRTNEAHIKKAQETRELTFVISTDTKDRHKDVLDMNNWDLEDFNANPVVGYQHNVYGDNMCNPPNPDDVLGKAKAWVDTVGGKKVLLSTVTFEPADMNPTAEKVFKKLQWGSLNAASVGILPKGKARTEYTKDEQGNIIDFTNFWGGQKLLEWSVVNIPANPDALRRSMKNHTNAALNFVQNLMQDYGMKDIRGMRVQEVLDIIDKKYKDVPIEEIEKELSGPDPNLNTFQNKLKKFRNG